MDTSRDQKHPCDVDGRSWCSHYELYACSAFAQRSSASIREINVGAPDTAKRTAKIFKVSVFFLIFCKRKQILFYKNKNNIGGYQWRIKCRRASISRHWPLGPCSSVLSLLALKTHRIIRFLRVPPIGSHSGQGFLHADPDPIRPSLVYQLGFQILIVFFFS